MKRLALTALALTLLAGTAATAAPQHEDNRRNGRYEQGHTDNRRHDRHEARDDRRDDRREYRRWARGQRLDARYRDNRHHVSDYRRHGLRTPPRGYRWQRVDDRYLLTAVATGLIISVILANH